jgi:signal transduction histidine kinase
VRLSTRFAVCVAVLVPLLVGLSGIIAVSVAAHDMRAERDRQLTVRMRALTATAGVYARRARPRSVIPPDVAAQRLAGVALGADSPGGVYVEVTGAEPLIVGDVPTALPTGGGRGPATFTRGERRWRYVMTELGGRNAAARLWVFEPDERLTRQLALLRRRLALVTLAAVGVGAAAGFGLGRFAVRPLAVLRGQARDIDRPPLAGARLATTSGVTEIDELAVLVNHLLDRRDVAVGRTAEALETARAFAATAAHELRTPLTSMGTNLSLLDHPGLDRAERAEILADLAGEHGRMQRLVTMLRQLARGELLDPATFAEVDLAEIVAAAAEESRRRHPHAAISTRLPGELLVRGSAEGLRVIALNLLDNAAIHGVTASGHAMIDVTLTPVDGAAVLAVQDSGPGIPLADRDAVFARFHRGAGSRGTGLGLTLVRQQAMRHGGGAAVAEPHGGGTRIEVWLPAAGQADHPTRQDTGTPSWLTVPGQMP